MALVAGLVLALTVVGVVSASLPASAGAFAWKDECFVWVRNDTPASPIVGAEHSTGGMDSSTHDGDTIAPGRHQSEKWWSVGYPITNGCSLRVDWKVGNFPRAMRTYLAAPSSGANTFDVSVWPVISAETWISAEKVITDDGWDIGGVVIVRRVGPANDSAPVLRPGLEPLSPAAHPMGQLGPKQVPSLLRRGDLSGRGWKRVVQVGNLGRLGEVLAAAKVPASCRDQHKQSEPSALKVGSSAFERRGGAEFIGAMNGVYANAKQSRRVIDDAVSAHSIGCLARLLSSKRFHTSVGTERLSVIFAGRRLVLHRLAIRTRSGKRITRTDYLDIAGLQHARANAVMMLASDKRPLDARTEAGAIIAVARRLP